MKLLNFIFLHRNWEKDRLKFGRRLRRLVFAERPFSLVIFPEGTNNSKDAVEKSDRFATLNHLPAPKHTLVPRVTGMQFALNTLGEHVGGIFDLTIGYTGVSPAECPEDTFDLSSLFFHGIAPPLIHIHVRYHNIRDVPYGDPAAFQKWLYDLFQQKDQLMAKFYQDGCFPGAKSRRVALSSKWAMPITIIAALASTWALVALVAAIIAWYCAR